MKRFLLVLFVFFSLSASAQLPHLKWVKDTHFTITSMVADEEDNIYLAGDISDTMLINNDTLIPVMSDVLLIKMDSTGSILWYKQVGGTDRDNAIDIRLGDNNDLYLLVMWDYTTIIEGDTIPFGVVGHAPLLVKYSTNGDFLWWIMPAYNYEGCLHPRMLRTDRKNNLLMMDETFGESNITYPDSTIADSLGYYHISKFNSDGDFQWVRAFNNEIHQLTTDYLNNILILKKTDTTGITDFIKLNPAGNLLQKIQINNWVFGYNDTPFGRWLSLLETDRFNNIYLATMFDTLSIGNDTFISKGSPDIILIKYDSTGNPIWGIPAGGPFYDMPTSLHIKGDKILMTGSFRKKIFFTSDSIIGYGTNYYNAKYGGFIVEYNLNGANESIKKVIGKYTSETILVTKGKSIYLFGFANDSTYLDDYLLTDTFPYPGISYLARFYDAPPPPEPIVDDFEIYPNPSKGTVNFNFNPSYGEVILQIYDLRGALIKTYMLSATHNTLDLDFLANGLYIARLISSVKVQCAKFEKI